mgnify:CR=1 FL=1
MIEALAADRSVDGRASGRRTAGPPRPLPKPRPRSDTWDMAFVLFPELRDYSLAGVANRTLIFCLPGSTGACRDGWDKILKFQLDNRQKPCNLVELMPRLQEHIEPAKN